MALSTIDVSSCAVCCTTGVGSGIVVARSVGCVQIGTTETPPSSRTRQGGGGDSFLDEIVAWIQSKSSTLNPQP